MKIATFESVRDVVLADMICREKGIRASIVSVPREISHGQGMALRLDPSELPVFEYSMKRNELTYELRDYAQT